MNSGIKLMTKKEQEYLSSTLKYALNDCNDKNGDAERHFNTIANAIDIVKNLEVVSNEISSKMKVFKFSNDVDFYIVASNTMENAKEYLNTKRGVYIKTCFEIPETEWDNRDILMYVDNNIDNEKFYTTIREQMPDCGTQLISATDNDILPF